MVNMEQGNLPKHLPRSTGPYAPGCVDVMTEYSKDGLFARIYYPTSFNDINHHTSRWPSWLPHKHYIVGFAYILNLWTFLIKLLMKYVAGDIKIPAIESGSVNRSIGKLKTVVFSHGLGGTRFFYTTICCDLASHGFVVIALEHRDDTPSMTYYYESEERLKNDEPTWLKFRRVKVGGPMHFPERKAQVEKRSSECTRALTLLQDLSAGKDIGNILKTDFDFSQFKDLLDFSKPVMMGHSFGGATALLTLGTDDRFKVGVILDPWMFSIKDRSHLAEKIQQPLLFVNTQTFHIPTNLRELSKYAKGSQTETYTIKHTTHENQSDTVHVIGYWLNLFMRKIDRKLGTQINNKLILRFLDKHVGVEVPVSAERFLNEHSYYVVDDISIDGSGMGHFRRHADLRYPLVLLHACRKGDLRLVKSLLRNHLNRHSDALDLDVLSVRDPNGAGIFHYAARGDQTNVFRFFWPFVRRRALPTTWMRSTPAHDAAALGNLKALQWLLKHRKDLATEKDVDGCTLVHLAARYGRVNVLRYLLWEEAMPALERSNNGAMALHYAAARGCLDCVKLLVESSELSANTQMDNDVTPVYLAAQEGHLEVLKFLVLEAGGSLYVRAKDGMAPVHAAAQMGCLPCLKWMVQDQGVDPNLRDGDGATPLHFAASRGHVDTVRWLLRHGARLTLDKYGKSPINDAAENQQMECLNILVQHGTVPDYYEDNGSGKIIGCTCRKGDPQQKCSYSDCVNFSSPRAPFYLHGPSPGDCPSHDGLYVNPMSHQHANGHETESFFLHNPQEVVYNRVKDLFEGTNRSEASSENGLIVKVEVHSSSSGAGSEENLSSSDMSERSEEHEHDYEDIYHLRDANATKTIRSRSRDSGSHSRSGSISSTNSGGIVVKLSNQDQPSITLSTESGVSSASPSDLGHSEEENEKSKALPRYSIHQASPYKRQLNRAVSEPMPCPPPPPPLPTPEMINTLPRKSSGAGEGEKEKDGSDCNSKAQNENGTIQAVGGEEESPEYDSSAAGPGLVKKLVLPSFIPPKFTANGENCLIKPSEYLKSIGGTRSVSFSLNGNTLQQKKCAEQKLDECKASATNGPPPPPLPCTSEKETSEQEAANARKFLQPLSAISIHDLNSVQLRRTVLQKTMSTPVKPTPAGNEPFQAQKQDLIAELKLSKDIEGVKKMKVERLKSEEKQEKEMVSEITKQLTANNLLEKIPEKDSTGNPIPPWKRQMMAKKAAERARKDLEEQMKREAEEKRMQSIPAWKRQLLAKKEENESRSGIYVPKLVDDKKTIQVVIKVSDKEPSMPSNETAEENNKENSRPEIKENGQPDAEEDDAQIIPWRAQLRKTNSKLSLLD